MSFTSTIPYATDALEDLFARTFANEGVTGGAVQVSQGLPRNTERERVQVGDIDNAAQDWAAFGLNDRDERYQIDNWIIVEKLPTLRDAKDRAFTLLAVAEEALRVDDPLLLRQVYDIFEVDISGILTARGGAQEEGFGYEIQFAVRIVAAI